MPITLLPSPVTTPYRMASTRRCRWSPPSMRRNSSRNALPKVMARRSLMNFPNCARRAGRRLHAVELPGCRGLCYACWPTCSRRRSSRLPPLIHPDERGTHACLGRSAQDGLPGARRVCARRVRGQLLRDAHPHDRGSGRCCGPGCARTATSRRRSCRSSLASSKSCMTRADTAKSCSAPSSLP